MAKPDGCEGRFDGVCGSQVVPMFGWEVVERQQDCSVFGEAFARRGILGFEFLNEFVEGLFRVRFGFGLPDFV